MRHFPCSRCSGTTTISKKEGYKIVNAFIDPEHFSSLVDGCPKFIELLSRIKESSGNSLFLWKTSQTKRIIAGLEELESINSSSFSPKAWEISKLYEIIMLIFTEFAEENRTDGKNNLKKHDIGKLIAIRNTLEAELISPPSVAVLAKSSGINQSKLQLMFKELFGTTIGGFVTERRMEKAKSMLESGSFSVSDAAWDLGYTNVIHFIKLFKKHFGITPGQFVAENGKAFAKPPLSKVRHSPA